MDDLGNILYFILIIGFSLFGVLKSKKNKQKEQAIPVNEIDQESVEDILRKLAREDQKTVVRESHIKSQKEEVKINNRFTTTSSTAPEYRRKTKKTALKVTTKDEEKELIEIDLNNQNNARKAFIYSEIFQRKY